VRDVVSALILAGGKATRMGGVAKHELVVDGRTIFDRLTELLAPRVQEILVATAADIAGHRCVRDVLPDVGPLAGIAAGLEASLTPWLLVVAGDMPRLTGAVIDALLGAVNDLDDAIGVRIGGIPEPLVCVLHRRALPAVTRRLANRRFKVSGLLTEERLHVRWLDLDAHSGAFMNVNQPEDLGGAGGSNPA
jgi:molybdopterin-guanine dinucleotide biosynthesis protein A